MCIDISDPIESICPSGRGAGGRKRDSHNSGDIILDRNVDRARYPRMDPAYSHALSAIFQPPRIYVTRSILRKATFAIHPKQKEDILMKEERYKLISARRLRGKPRG